MTSILHFSSQQPNIIGWDSVSDVGVTVIAADHVPSVETLAARDVISVMGDLGDAARARQFGAATRLAMSEGKIVVVSYPGVLDQALRAFLLELVPIDYTGIPQWSRIDSQSEPFTAYFQVFGHAAIAFTQTGGAEVLGTVPLEGVPSPAAFCYALNGGLVYVVPYELAGGEAFFVESLFKSVLQHASGVGGGVPPFLQDLFLPGERELHEEIRRREDELGALREQANHLEHFRHLLGPRGSGTFLEQLVIETLNTILDGTDHLAEDRDDVRAEDFWIVGPDGDAALAEVKGVNRNILREDVNQVDSHREALPGGKQDLPGLLIVNIFRGHDELGQRRIEVPDQTVRRALQSNVLVLRSIDLYELLAMKLGGNDDVGRQLIEHLNSGGGWLEIDQEGMTLHAMALPP